MESFQKINLEKQKIKKVAKIYVWVVVVIAIFFLGFILGHVTDNKQRWYELNDLTTVDMPDTLNHDLFQVVWSYLNKDFVGKDSIDPQKMFYSALTGFVAGADDPYTVFMNPDQTQEFAEDINGQFTGIGAEVGMRNDRLTIIAPLPDSPAEKAGLMAGDKIYAIDNLDTTGMSVDKAVKLIRGPKGTVVTLIVMRNDEELLEISIERDVIETKSMKWEFRNDGILYIELSAFYEDTTPLFNQMIKQAKNHNITGIILDLRNDPGGLLTEANFVASRWVDNGQVIAIERFSDGREIIYRSKNTPDFKNIPTIILIDGGSASASEIVAGALKDHNLATLVGEKTFGKGSVQELKLLPDGSSLKVTTAAWYTPNGNSIDKIGIEPDILVEYTAEDVQKKQDPQLEKALEMLK